ncbi:TIR domain-containing protein [Streptomyces sp. MN13]
MTDASDLIFVHHAGEPDDQWAEWVAWQLEEAGYRVELRLWHWRAGDDFVAKMNAALERCSAVVAVLSPHYFEPGRNTEAVWGAVVGRLGRLVPVAVRPLEKHQLPAVLSSRLIVQLHDLDEPAAVKALTQAVRGSGRPQSPPPFPSKSVRPQPRFPAEPSAVAASLDRYAGLVEVEQARAEFIETSASSGGFAVTGHSPRHTDVAEADAGDRAIRYVAHIGYQPGQGVIGADSGQPEAFSRRRLQTWAAEPVGRPVRSVDPYHLEVHPSIAVQGAEGLPAYVQRPHDKRLRAIVARAVGGRSQFVMLVGTSSSGKTRTCYEALQALPDDWRLWHPFDPDRPRAALAQLERVGPKTVVWLNEAHHYLLHLEHSEAIAAGLRTLLSDDRRAPVLVLGTIWPGPGYFDELRSAPPTQASLRAGVPEPPPNQRDPFSQARLLVAGHDLHVPTSFSAAEVEQLRQSSDPRLVDAAQSARDGMVTQYLAAAFELVAIYNQAPPEQRALLDAAVDARRLGHPLRLSLPLLLEAAEAYLTDTEWDLLPDNWHTSALAQLAAPVKGVHGPLYVEKRPRGVFAGKKEPTHEPAYRVADFLVDHLRAQRRAQPIPALFWEAAARHCAGQGARDLAVAAASRGLKQIACLLWSQAGEFGEVWTATR